MREEPEKAVKKRRFMITDIILIMFVLAIILPVAVMLVWTVTERWAWPDLWPQVFSLRALDGIFQRSEVLTKLFASSIIISSAVALLSVAIGTMTARALVLYEFPGKGLVYFLTVLPFMVPATVFAMGVQITFIKLGLNNTVAGVVIAHLICSLPYGVRLLMDGTAAVGARLEDQARVLGASAGQAFFRVTLPCMSPSIFFAVVMTVISSFQVFDQTFVSTMGGPNNETNTLVLYLYNDAFKYQRLGYASAIAWVLFFCVLIVTAFLMKQQKRFVNYES